MRLSSLTTAFDFTRPASSERLIPSHVAVIMDGNGRWAEKRRLPRKLGHKRGAEALKGLIEDMDGLGVEYLTVYAFSSENWQRSDDEVSDLMELLRFYLRREIDTLHDNNIRIRFIGDRTQLSEDIQSELQHAETLTANNTRLTFTVALSYGSRQEIIRAIQQIATRVKAGEIVPEAIDESLLLASLDTHDLPDPDLLIRTGGEQRLSNYLLWQSAYTELYFTEVLWPDFTIEHLQDAINDYGRRERRFGTRRHG